MISKDHSRFLLRNSALAALLTLAAIGQINDLTHHVMSISNEKGCGPAEFTAFGILGWAIFLIEALARWRNPNSTRLGRLMVGFLMIQPIPYMLYRLHPSHWIGEISALCVGAPFIAFFIVAPMAIYELWRLFARKRCNFQYLAVLLFILILAAGGPEICS